MKKQKQSDVAFLMMKDWREQFNMLTDEQKGIMLTAIYDYQCDGIDFETDDPVLKIFWVNIRRIFEINQSKYEETCRQNRRNAKKRWAENDATACDRIFLNAKDADIDIEKDTDKDIDKETDIVIDIERGTEADTDATAASSAAKTMKRFDEVVASPKYQGDEMREYDSVYSYIRVGEMLALYDFIEESAVERYLNNALAYNSKDPAKMILNWAIADGTLIKT